MSAGNVNPNHAKQMGAILQKMYDLVLRYDATLVEINPCAALADGRVVALDGKMEIDESAYFRQQDIVGEQADETEHPLEKEANEKGLAYVKLDGEVGIIGNGAGLVMTTLDMVAYAGEKHNDVKPANFLDIGGGASAEIMANGLDVILGDEQVKSVFVNVFGGITA